MTSTEPTEANSNDACPPRWQVFSDPNNREVSVFPEGMAVLTLSPMGIFTKPVGAAGSDPRETCEAAIAKCYQRAAEHKQYAEDAAGLGDHECEGNHVLARAAEITLARRIEVLVHCYDNNLHGRKWPSQT